MSAPTLDPRRTPGRPGNDSDAVLRQAISLFNRQGYDATSISDIAAALGVTKSAIYHHFPSKESLLGAALDEALVTLQDAVDRAAAENAGGTAYDRLRATVASAVEILAEHLPAVTLLLRVRGNSELETSAITRRRRIDDQLADLVRHAATEGTLRRDLDPELVSRVIFGTVNSLTDWYRPDGALDAAGLADAVAGILFDGLHAS